MEHRSRPRARTIRQVGALVLVGILLTGCLATDKAREIDLNETVSDAELQARAAAANEDVFLFGFDLRSTPQEDARQYLPFLKYLERATGYSFRLRFTPKDGQVVDDLGRGDEATGATNAAQPAPCAAAGCAGVHRTSVVPSGSRHLSAAQWRRQRC